MTGRRDFMKGGLALVSIGTTAQSLLKGSVAFAAQNPGDVAPRQAGKILILVQLAGGNDGLNTLIPIGDSAYHSVRKTIGIDDAQALPLVSAFGLCPELKGVKGLWDAGHVAIVRGVGYPEQNYSHFRSMAIWEAGDPELKLDNGWLGRTLDQMESEQHDPFLGLASGIGVPPEMIGNKTAITAIGSPGDYGFRTGGAAGDGTDGRSQTLVKLYEQYPANSPFGVLLETTAGDAVSSSKQLAAIHGAYPPAVQYPATAFGEGLSLLAEAIVGNLGMRVGHITLGSFDTHVQETERHSQLMTEFDDGVTAFYNDLAAHNRADDVLVLTWSEFGRRVAENANGGTDHGSASIMFALGSQVKGGLYGDQPSMTQLIDNGNLSFTTDFRSVYSTVIERWLGVPAQALLGKAWPQLDFIPTA